MTITPKTRISEIVKLNKDSIGVIASLAKPLEKLRNPILRKVMAPRVTLADAAKMGGCELKDMIAALEKIGFTFEKGSQTEDEASEKPEWLVSANDKDINTFDARDVLDKGEDPLKEILQAFRGVNPGGILRIITGFVPVPLINLLKQKEGVDAYVHNESRLEFHTYFYKHGKPVQPKIKQDLESGPVMHDAESFAQLKSTFGEDKIQSLDVRHMEMPLPMQTILAALPELTPGKALWVIHKRVPVYLLEEMASMNFEVHILKKAETDVELFIFART